MNRTQTTPQLRLAGTPADEGQPAATRSNGLRFERRGAGRWPMRGRVTISELAPERFNRTHEARLLDHSDFGYGLICDEPVDPGMPVSMQFEGLGMPMERGLVVRCQRCADGWRLSVQVEQRRAA